MNYIGDYPEDFTTVCVYFTTHDSNGAPVAPLTAFEADDVKIYKNGSNAQKTSTNGLTMTSPFDSIVGLHCLVIDTSNDTGDSGFWTTGGGGIYTVVLNPDTETVNGQTVVKVLATFGLATAPALRPTVAGRTLDVSSTGEAGVDWANVGSPTTTLALTGTTIAVTQKVDVDTIKTNPVVNGGTLTFPSGATLASTTNITAGTVTTATNVTTVNGLASGVITAASIAADAIGASELAADAVTEIRSLASGTSDSGTTTTMVDAARTEADADYWAGSLIVFTSGNIAGQARLITAFNASTDTITFTPATTQAVATQTYEIWPATESLRPTVSGRTLDVSSTGEAGVDWANVGSPTTSLALTGTTIATTQKVDIETIKTNPVVNGGTITFPTTATLASTTNITAGTITTATNVTTVNGLAAGVITATSIAADAITDAKVASDVTIASVTGAVGSVTGAVGSVTGNVGGNVTGSVGSVVGAVGSVTGNVGGNVTGTIGGLTAAALKDFFDTDSLTTFGSAVAGSVVKEIADNASGGGATAADVADAVWDEARSGHVTSGSFGEGVASVQGNVTGSVASVAGNVVGSVGSVIGAVGSVTGTVGSVTGAVGSVTGNVGGNVTGSVGSVATDGISAASLAADAGTEIGIAVWASTTRLLTAGTNIVLAKGTGITGFNDLSAAQVNAEADTALSDVGLTGTVTGRIDAAISTRLASASYTAPDNSSITAIKAKTDSLTFTIAGNLDANIQRVNDIVVTGTGTTGNPWGP